MTSSCCFGFRVRELEEMMESQSRALDDLRRKLRDTKAESEFRNQTVRALQRQIAESHPA